MSIKLHHDIKKLWLEALRSGEYIQGTGELRDEQNQFCCLGVLCDLHSKEFKIEWDEAQQGEVHYKYGGCGGIQPSIVSMWAWPNYPHTVPYVTINGKHKTLDAHNDDGCTFAEIADAIEEQL